MRYEKLCWALLHCKSTVIFFNTSAIVFNVSKNDPYFVRGIIITITALQIALCRQLYDKTYMNVLDTILLLHFGLLCHLISAATGFANKKNLGITFEVMIMLPLFCGALIFIAKVLKFRKISRSVAIVCGVLC